jgi:hypothetical protein
MSGTTDPETIVPRRTKEVAHIDGEGLALAALLDAQEPVIFRGFADGWPLVAAGRSGPDVAIDYLKRFDAGRPVVAYSGPPDIGGRFFYRDDFSGLNFEAGRVFLSDFLNRIASHIGDAAPPSLYIGSTDLDQYLPGLRAVNDVRLPTPQEGQDAALASIWIGNRTIAATHYDMSNNIACCMVGARRFTLFPPDQIANLYPGPLEPTPGGQVVSMVDLRAPDFDRYPRFKEAMASAQTAELNPGDVLFYPAMWWHNVEALDDFNVMINYWWNDVPAFLDPPMTTLLHAMLSLRDRPVSEKRAWQALFDYYVWGEPGRAAAHLPELVRGNLAPMSNTAARRLRAHLLERMNR